VLSVGAIVNAEAYTEVKLQKKLGGRNEKANDQV
jgi:hypothetical protein